MHQNKVKRITLEEIGEEKFVTPRKALVPANKKLSSSCDQSFFQRQINLGSEIQATCKWDIDVTIFPNDID